MVLNPILEKDMKTKMRSWRTPVLLSLYLLFLGAVLFLFFLGNNQIFDRYGYSPFNPRTAVSAYNVIALFQFALLMLIVPALTATAISGERERQTLDLMLCSSISPWSVVTGKLGVSIAHIMFLVVASLPVLGMVFLFGGISFGEILLLFLFYAVTALMAASLGMFISTLFRRNVTAIITTYICLGVIGLGPVIALFIWSIFFELRAGGTMTYGTMASFLFPSPAFGFSSFVTGDSGFFGGIFIGLQRYADRDATWLRYFKPWMINGLFDMVFSGILICLSAWKLNPVKERRRKVKKARKDVGQI